MSAVSFNKVGINSQSTCQKKEIQKTTYFIGTLEKQCYFKRTIENNIVYRDKENQIRKTNPFKRLKAIQYTEIERTRLEHQK